MRSLISSNKRFLGTYFVPFLINHLTSARTLKIILDVSRMLIQQIFIFFLDLSDPINFLFFVGVLTVEAFAFRWCDVIELSENSCGST